MLPPPIPNGEGFEVTMRDRVIDFVSLWFFYSIT